MNILPFVLFGFICASIVVFIFITVSFLVVASSSNKDREDEEQIQWIEEYKDKPYESMYQNEIAPDRYLVDENGVWKNK